MTAVASIAVDRPAVRRRGPVLATVTRDAWDEAQVEIAARQAEAIALCNAIQPRLERLHGAMALVHPVAEQLCAGALHEIRRYRARNEA